TCTAVGFAGDGGPGTEALLNQPGMLAISPYGLLINDRGNHCIRALAADGTISTVVGECTVPLTDITDPAQQDLLAQPTAIAADHNGRIFIADAGVIRVFDGGVMHDLAGRGALPPSDGQIAADVKFSILEAVAVIDQGDED